MRDSRESGTEGLYLFMGITSLSPSYGTFRIIIPWQVYTGRPSLYHLFSNKYRILEFILESGGVLFFVIWMIFVNECIMSHVLFYLHLYIYIYIYIYQVLYLVIIFSILIWFINFPTTDFKMRFTLFLSGF